jgi:hypothetical protein
LEPFMTSDLDRRRSFIETAGFAATSLALGAELISDVGR